MKKLTLSTIVKGTPENPRYILVNGDTFWTGRNWSKHESEALLFHDERELSELCDKLYRLENIDKPVQKFVIPIEVEVFGDDVAINKLRWWLAKVLRLELDYNKAELGSDVLATVNWKNLKKEDDNEPDELRS